MIFDFDGTLILENSSRELEKVVLGYLSGARLAFTRFVFFTMAPFTDRVLGLMSRMFYRRRDLRSRLFCYLTSDILANNFRQIVDETSAKLNFNRALVSNICFNEVVILSCGLDAIIARFLEVNNFEFVKMKCSELKNRGGKIAINLMSSEDKLGFLADTGNFTYWTDDPLEAGLISSRFGKAKGKVFDFGDRKIFEVTL